MPDCDALAAEVRRLAYSLDLLERAVGQIARFRPAVDSRLGPLLAQIHAFAYATHWTAAELLADAARADSGLWLALEAITGPDASAIRLGRWLERHDGVEIDGYRLQRIRRDNNGSWLYAVAPGGESTPRLPLSIAARSATLR